MDIRGFKRDGDGWLYWAGGRDYREPDEAIKTSSAGRLKFGCNAEIFEKWYYRPCGKPPRHDPDKNGNPTKCGTHSKAAVERRRAKRDQRFAEQKAKWARDGALLTLRDELETIVRSIALGHNDPRSLCADWVRRRDEIEQSGEG